MAGLREQAGDSGTGTVAWPIVALLLALAPGGQAQELVRNGSFEQQRGCPTPFPKRALTNLPNVKPARGKPAHFHACNSVAGAPSNWAGHQTPWHGDGYAGLVLTAHGGGECATREFVQLALSQPLVNGVKYRLRFYVSLADHSGYMTDRIGAVFTTHDRSGKRGIADLIGKPHVDNPLDHFLADSAGWTPVEGIYNATGGERYLLIGNFQACDRTSRKAVTANKGEGVLHNMRRKLNTDLVPDKRRNARRRMLATQAYYYLDGVSLHPVTGMDGPDLMDPATACTLQLPPPPDTPQLVPDPGFDRTKPAHRSAWQNASGGTPDFLSGLAGIYLHSAVNRDHREFIRTELHEPLHPCGRYTISMRIKREAAYGYAVDRIGVAVVDTFVMERRRDLLPILPSWTSATGSIMASTEGWSTLCGEFHAPGCGRTLVIGNFDSDDATSILLTDPRGGPFAYYLLDDVMLWRTGTEEGCDRTCPDMPPLSVDTMPVAPDPGPWPVALHFAVADAIPFGDLKNVAEEMLQALAMEPRARFLIEGHTDAQGTEAANQQLSERRAQAVRDDLVRLGVPKNALSVSGLGSSVPVADNATPEGRERNRRVEVRPVGPAP